MKLIKILITLFVIAVIGCLISMIVVSLQAFMWFALIGYLTIGGLLSIKLKKVIVNSRVFAYLSKMKLFLKDLKEAFNLFILMIVIFFTK